MTAEELKAHNKKKSTTLMSMSDFICWLNSMTTTELHDVFFRTFHPLRSSDSPDVTVSNMLANDAIMWRLVKDYNKFLLRKVTKEMLISEKALIKNPEKAFTVEYVLSLIEKFTIKVHDLLTYTNEEVELFECPVR